MDTRSLDSSTSSEDENSETTASTVSCDDVMPHGEPLALNGIGTINLDNCQDSHIGPKITIHSVNTILHNSNPLQPISNPLQPNSNLLLSNPNPLQPNSNPLQTSTAEFGFAENIVKRPLNYESQVGWRYGTENVFTSRNEDMPIFSRKNDAKVRIYRSCGWKAILVVCLSALILSMVIIMLSTINQEVPGGTNRTTGTAPSTNTTVPVTATTAPVTETTAPVTETTAPVTETTGPATSAPPPVGQLYSRNQWNGMEPPSNMAADATNQFIAVDNLQGDHCSSLSSCGELLQKREKAANASLSFNFLIDDSGNVFEVRGWNFKPDSYKQADNTVKVGFIGNYTKQHVTSVQIASFKEYILGNAEHVLDEFEIEAQCCRTPNSESIQGPNENVICDLRHQVRFVKAQNCRNCGWTVKSFCDNK